MSDKTNLFLDSKALKLLQEKEDRQEKILTLEDAFEKIKSAIYVSNINVSS